MPFSTQIVNFINESLQTATLDKSKLQPADFFGLSTTIVERKEGNTAFLPGIVSGNKSIVITADQKKAIIIYHKLTSKQYSIERRSFGDEFSYKSIADVQMMIYNNCKITQVSKYSIEPLVVFGFPQKLSPQLQNELGLTNCTISVTGSGFDSVSLFKQEFPGAEYFLNQHVELLQVKYRIETIFSRKCVESCLC